MAQVLWNLVQAPDIAGSFSRGYAGGRQIAADRERRSVLAELAQLPPSADQSSYINRLMAVDPQGASTLAQLVGLREDRAFRRESREDDVAWRQAQAERQDRQWQAMHGLARERLNVEREGVSGALGHKVRALIASGVDPQTAMGIASGRFKMTDAGQLIDMATGRPLEGQSGPSPQEVPPQSSMPTEGVNYRGATGVGGYATNLLNTATGAFGATFNPQVDRGVQAFNNLNVRTKTMLQASVPGRPSNYLLQQLERLAVSPADWSMGPERAKERLQQTREMLMQELQRIDRDILSRPGEHTRAQLSETRQNRSQLAGVLADYDTILQNFDVGSNPTESMGNVGTQWIRENLPSPLGINASPANAQQPQQIIEGMTATNPQTGQRIMFRNGQWIPVQ